MDSDRRTYMWAAEEHLARAQELFESHSYVLSHYLSGLAVECHLRAWLCLKTDGWEHSHSLQYLATKSAFLGLIRGKGTEGFSTAFNLLSRRWRSKHRFCPERQFYELMSKDGFEKQSMGPGWKETIARAALNSAHVIIKQGVAKWNQGSRES